MAKTAISVTLDEDNLLWLKGRAVKAHGSLSAALNDLVAQARAGRLSTTAAARSVVGTIDLPPDDPTLSTADKVVRAVFERSLARPLVARENAPAYTAPRKKPRRG